ncbi:MAG: PAS domain S-box protein [Desulfovermiculus sp.]
MSATKPSYEEVEFRITELEHLNRVFMAARRLGRVISPEKDRDRVIQRACDLLIEEDAYSHAWIVLFDAQRGYLDWAEAGWGSHFLPVLEKLRGNESFFCCQRAPSQAGFIAVYNPASTCPDCPLADKYGDQAAMAAALKHEGTTYGVLAVTVPKPLATSREVHTVFQEVAADISSHLHNMHTHTSYTTPCIDLQHGEDFLNILLETIPIPVFYKDKQGRYLGFNKTFETLFGFTRENLIGKTVFDVYPEELAQVYYAMDKQLFKTGGEQVYESHFCNADFALRQVIFHKAAYMNNQGIICGLIGAILDVTEYKQAEKDLQQSEKHYRSIFENTGAATIIVEEDTTISLSNTKFALLSGYSKEELEWNKSWKDFVAFESELKIMEKHHHQRRVNSKDVPQEYEFLFIDRYGKLRNVSLTIDIIPETGKSIASIMDITELKQVQKALSEREKKYRLLAENTADIIWSVDADLNFTYVSPSIERILGYTQQEAYEIGLAQRITPASYRMLMDKYHQAKAARLTKTLTVELEQIHKNGSIVPVEVSMTPLFDHDHHLLGIQGVTRDITLRKKEERIKHTHKRRLRALAAKLASAQDMEQRRIAEGLHDDVAQLLSACSYKLSMAHGTHNIMQVHEITHEIQNLITLSNERIHQLCFELTSSTLYKLGLRAAIKELCESIEYRYGVHFIIQGNGQPNGLDEESATVLFKAIRELLFNVIKHAGVKEGLVTISFQDHMLKLEVEDHGRGFTQEHRNEEQNPGKGLGLFGIQERLGDLGGTMHIHSVPNRLTRVTLLTPLEIC